MKMKKINFTSFFLIILIVLMILLLLWISNVFKNTEQKMQRDLFNNQLSNMIQLTHNMSEFLSKKYGENIYEKLKNNKEEQKFVDMYLHSFMTKKIKNIFIVYKIKNENFFRVLADGSINSEDKFLFNEKFEPLERKIWEKVLKLKKKIVFKQEINDIWSTLLYPVVIDGKLKYIIVVDFSTLPIKRINRYLEILKSNLNIFILVILVSIFVLLIFIVYDFNRQLKMEKLIKQLKDLNDTLEDRIIKEIKKNREKDKQLILQSRLALMGELLSMIAHQWRQPLNVIGIIVSQLKLDIQLGKVEASEVKKAVDKIENLIQHLSNTIDDFRKFYRKEEKESEVYLKDVVDQTLNIARASIENKNIDIQVNIECESKLKTFPNELKQVLLNIIRNAEDILVERKVQNAYIKIEAYMDTEKDACIIQIKDNAGGVDESIIDQIFNPYFSTKNEKNGTGLGLYMSRQIVQERLKGNLTVHNDDFGAVFTIELKNKAGNEG